MEIRLIIVVLFDLETSDGDGTKPYAVAVHTVSKIMEKYDTDLISEQIEVFRSNTIVLEDEDFITQNFENLKKYEGESEWTKTKSKPMIREYGLKIFAHKGSSFDSWNNLNGRHIWCRITKPLKTAKILITVKCFNQFCLVIETYKREPQNSFSIDDTDLTKSSSRKHLEYNKKYLKKALDHKAIHGWYMESFER